MLGTISVFQEHSSQFRFYFCLHRTRQLSEAGIGVDAVSCQLPDPLVAECAEKSSSSRS